MANVLLSYSFSCLSCLILPFHVIELPLFKIDTSLVVVRSCVRVKVDVYVRLRDPSTAACVLEISVLLNNRSPQVTISRLLERIQSFEYVFLLLLDRYGCLFKQIQ